MKTLHPIFPPPPDQTADEIIADLEELGYGWSIDHTSSYFYECRIWNWPWVVGRYRPGKIEPLADMLRGAINNIGNEPKDVG